MGWRILNTIINHPKLNKYKVVNVEELYHDVSLNIVEILDSKHSNYNYEIWYKNGRNDVYVRSDNTVYCYKFYDNGNRLVLTKGEIYE